MLRIYKFLISFFIIFFFTHVYALESDWSMGIESQTRIVSPFTNNNDQNEFYIGLEYKLKKDWKTYWKSSGEGGFPQEIVWKSSQNIKDLEIFWPKPKYFEILGFTSIGYQDEVLFPLKINIDDITKNTKIVLDINYLTCKDICIPGKANLELNIPPGKGKISKYFFDLEKSISSVPKKDLNFFRIDNFSTKALENDENISILITAESKDIIKNPEFFIHSDFGLPVVKPKIQYSADSKKINAKFDFNKKNFSKKNFLINVVFENDKNSFEYISQVEVEKFSQISILNNSFIYILIISLFGGIILNVMPCVLPVISIKIMSVLNNSTNQLLIRKSFFITSLGIVSSFGLLAFIFILLRLFGTNIAWGMQFQQPIFLILISIILLFFSLNLIGIYEFKVPAFLNNKFIYNLGKNNNSKDFFNGFFATILATPCSAPFVGTAITVAFTQSSLVMIGIFIFMGLGMATPYLLISAFPSISLIIPKPGRWMQNIKYFLAALLFATFLWIISILMSHYSFFSPINQKKDNDWLDFNTVDIENLRKDNGIIFVDITADWCATCKFNKINVINSEEIKEKFEKFNVVKVKGDWTKPNEKIENFLSSFNKFGIPFNVIYTDREPHINILSELLSKEQIIKYIDK